MTDDEIRQSRIDHWHLWNDIAALVRESTPSRIVVVRPSAKRKPMLFDFVRQQYVEAKRAAR